MEQQTINQILENFTQVTGVKAKWRPIRQADYVHYDYIDGLVQFGNGQNKIEIPAEGIINVQNPSIPHLMNLININKNVLVIAKTLLPRFKKELQKLGVNYIDAAGNAHVIQNGFVILIDGRKETTTPQDLKTKPFSKAGLKVIFLLMQLNNYINETVREIAKATNVSLDTVHKTINGLKELQYLVPLNNYTFQWNKKKELLERWITEYETRLKLSLHIGNFTFLNDKDFLNWKKMKFRSQLTKWGGEPAGELLTGYLKPEKLMIYTNENRLDWIKNYKMVPDPKGYINIYTRFWKIDELHNYAAPPLLVYADLINTGNRRNIETAQKIYEQYLQDKF